MPPPPVMATINMNRFEAERGTVTCGVKVDTFHYNPLGGMHGGMISTLLDTAAGCAVHSTLEVGQGYTSLDLTVKFLRPVTRGLRSGDLRRQGALARAAVRRSPRRSCSTRAASCSRTRRPAA